MNNGKTIIFCETEFSLFWITYKLMIFFFFFCIQFVILLSALIEGLREKIRGLEAKAQILALVINNSDDSIPNRMSLSWGAQSSYFLWWFGILYFPLIYVMFYMMLALCIIVCECWLNYLHNCFGCIWYSNLWTWPTNVGAEGTRPISKFFEKK